MKTRQLRQEYFINDKLAGCGPLAHVLYLGLLGLADREGRLEERPFPIKVQVIPYYECDILALLTALHNHELITRYSVDGKNYIEIIDYKSCQNIHPKEVQSNIPALKDIAIPRNPGMLPDGYASSNNNTNNNTNSNNTSTTEPTSKSMCAREPQVVKQSLTTGKAMKVREPERAEFVHISDQNYSKLIAKYGEAKTKEACEILSAWISSKVGQLSWFEKKYSGAFEILNNKTCWVWEKVKSTEPPKSKRQLMLNGWMEKAFADIEAEKASSLTAEDLNYYETLLITE
jgi:hypothetical protein